MTHATVSTDDLHVLNRRFATQSPQDVVRYALERFFPQVALACSFGAEDMALWDMMYRLNPRASLLYLDTDFLFPETLDVRDRLMARYDVTDAQMIRVRPSLTPAQQAEQCGDQLWSRHPDQCCRIRKIDPLTEALTHYAAWMTGIRRDQSPTRAGAAWMEWDATFGLVKFNPLAAWTHDDVWAYIHAHDVPYNVLHDRGYPSIGCTHCTAPVNPGDDPRAGRWQDREKTECGLHPSSRVIPTPTSTPTP